VELLWVPPAQSPIPHSACLFAGAHGFEGTVVFVIDDQAVILERGDTATVEPGRAAKSEDAVFALIETPAVAKFGQRSWRKNVGR
jgi:hypothetical protein